MEWKKGRPQENRPVMVTANDYMGEFQFIAEWVPYSLKGPKRQHGKGRWMKRNERNQLERVGRKETPESWRELSQEEFMDYYGLGPDDMRQDY